MLTNHGINSELDRMNISNFSRHMSLLLINLSLHEISHCSFHAKPLYIAYTSDDHALDRVVAAMFLPQRAEL